MPIVMSKKEKALVPAPASAGKQAPSTILPTPACGALDEKPGSGLLTVFAHGRKAALRERLQPDRLPRRQAGPGHRSSPGTVLPGEFPPTPADSPGGSPSAVCLHPIVSRYFAPLMNSGSENNFVTVIEPIDRIPICC